jgi:hypothetical protein
MTSSEAAAGAITSDDIAKRSSLAALDSKESLSEMQSAYPGLALSGNIISATFNIPHSLRYHKGADWVSLFHLLNLPMAASPGAEPFLCAALHCSDDLLVGWWG